MIQSLYINTCVIKGLNDYLGNSSKYPIKLTRGTWWNFISNSMFPMQDNAFLYTIYTWSIISRTLFSSLLFQPCASYRQITYNSRMIQSGCYIRQTNKMEKFLPHSSSHLCLKCLASSTRCFNILTCLYIVIFSRGSVGQNHSQNIYVVAKYDAELQMPWICMNKQVYRKWNYHTRFRGV
jgi:hypothetical protein